MFKTAFVYPGQGSQKCGMGRDFYTNFASARRVFDDASEALELDIKQLCFQPDERLDMTEYTQAAMVTTCMAITEVLREQGLKPDTAAGLSLGEYCAVSAAGAMNTSDAISVVRQRGIFMQEAVPAGVGAMAAVLGMEKSGVESVMQGMDGVYIANDNCPGQLVISGYKEAVQSCMDALSEAGARRTVLLNVSGPFHSPLLSGAGKQLEKTLSGVVLDALEIPYVTNVTGQFVSRVQDIKPLLVQQVSSPVLWQQCVKTMVESGVEQFVEIGPGKTLSAFIRKIDRNTKVMNVETVEDLDNLMEKMVMRRC